MNANDEKKDANRTAISWGSGILRVRPNHFKTQGTDHASSQMIKTNQKGPRIRWNSGEGSCGLRKTPIVSDVLPEN